jgi:hypothetical protein
MQIKMYRFITFSVVLFGCETWSHTLMEEHRLKEFKNRVVRKLLGDNREEQQETTEQQETGDN